MKATVHSTAGIRTVVNHVDADPVADWLDARLRRGVLILESGTGERFAIAADHVESIAVE